MGISDIKGDTVGNDVGNDVGNAKDSEQLLLELIRQNAEITAKELATILKLSERQCERIIAYLTLE